MYKHSARALQDRKLVTISRRGGWSATITDAGRQLLDGSAAPTPRQRASRPSTRRTPQATKTPQTTPAPIPRVTVSPRELVEQVVNAGGTLTVEDPLPELRAAYRRAIHRATGEKMLPQGTRLRHNGRDDGDLVIRLIDATPPLAEPEIAVPAMLEDPHPVVAHLGDDPAFPVLTPPARDRAVRLLEGLVREAERRGYAIAATVAGGDLPGLRVSVGPDDIDLTLAEEIEQRRAPSPEAVVAAKYAWQRVPSERVPTPTGRLRLTMFTAPRPLWWADRRARPLEHHLAGVFEQIESHAASRRAARDAEAARREKYRIEWHAARERATREYVDEGNRQRLSSQLESWRQARRIRRYCDELEAVRLGEHDPAVRDRLDGWLTWMRGHADAIDPLRRPSELSAFAPSKPPSDYDLSKFMPAAYSIWRPPESAE